MVNEYRNSYLPIIIAEIKNSPIYRRFLDVLRDYDIRAIYDSHAHVSSGREETIGEASTELMPKFPFTIGDINHLYDELFGSEGIDFATVVFDSPLAAYDLAKKNDQLLAELRETNHKGLTKAIPFVVVTPEMTAEQIKEYVEHGAKGFKMSPRTSSLYVRRGVISDVSLAEMLNPDALRIANSHGLPLVVHLPQLVVSPRMKPSLREELGQVAIRYPHLKVILAHLGQAQSPGKIEDLLDWIEKNNLAKIIWMDISAVTVPSVLEIAFSSNVKLLFGTDIDFSIAERGRYIMFRYEDGQRVLADDYERGSVITALVSTSFGDQLKGFAAENGIDLDAPMLIFQLEGILDAIDRLQRRGKAKAEVKLILENLFFRNAEVLLSSGNS
jgi:predicted TIM-barrel fold metal-dependent hydrolase